MSKDKFTRISLTRQVYKLNGHWRCLPVLEPKTLPEDLSGYRFLLQYDNFALPKRGDKGGIKVKIYINKVFVRDVNMLGPDFIDITNESPPY